MRVKSFRKKNKIETVLIASITYITNMYLPQPTHQGFYLQVRIFTRNHPRKSFLFMKTFFNLFCR